MIKENDIKDNYNEMDVCEYFIDKLSKTKKSN